MNVKYILYLPTFSVHNFFRYKNILPVSCYKSRG